MLETWLSNALLWSWLFHPEDNIIFHFCALLLLVLLSVSDWLRSVFICSLLLTCLEETCILCLLQVDLAPVCAPYIAVPPLVAVAAVVELQLVVLLVQVATTSWRSTRSSWSSCWIWRSAAAWSLCGASSLGLPCLCCTAKVCKHTSLRLAQMGCLSKINMFDPW